MKRACTVHTHKRLRLMLLLFTHEKSSVRNTGMEINGKDQLSPSQNKLFTICLIRYDGYECESIKMATKRNHYDNK